MAISKHEAECQKILDDWLKQQCKFEAPQWNEGHEPPDLLLSISGRDYSVEVSRLAWYEPCGDQDLPIDSAQSAIERMVKRVEERARNEGKLCGLYIIDFITAVPGLGKVKQELESQVFSFISRTRDEERPPSFVLKIDGCEIGGISKHGGSLNAVEVCGPDNRGGWLDEVEGQISSLLAERIQAKQLALSRGNCPRPWILVLDDQYALADDSHFVSCLPWIEAANDFDTIIIIRPGIRILALKKSFISVSQVTG